MSKYRRKPLTSPALKTRTTPAGVYSKLSGKSHLHACSNPECRLIYIDNCKQPRVNERCSPCSGGHPRPLWETARDPRPCCLDNTQQIVDADELIRYDLAGPGPWFQCRTCARCHPRPCVSPIPKGTP